MKTMVKRIAAIFLIAGLIIGSQMIKPESGNVAMADASGTENIQIGDYIQLGKYNDEPILWRYVADDENGKLILSDKIISFKIFDEYPYNSRSGSHARRSTECPGNNYWGDSNIRSWLNSTAGAGEVEWLCGNPPKPIEAEYSYADEKGFLADGNFTESERTVLKEVSIKTILDPLDAGLATEGSAEAWREDETWGNDDLSFIDDTLNTFDENKYNEISAEYTTDKVFLPDIKQICQVYNTSYLLGDYHRAVNTEAAGIGLDDMYKEVKFHDYWLRTPYGIPYGNPLSYHGTGARAGLIGDNGAFWHNYSDYSFGIRPAFYLNDENAVKLSGNGTEEAPYVLTGKESEEISVFCNGTKLEFDQTPIMEGDRVLVPMRVIFETLGADVEWSGEILTATAVRGETTISLQIDSNIMYKNGEAIELDVPARLLNDRTLVPIRAVSEAMEAKVEWNQEDKAVVITTE